MSPLRRPGSRPAEFLPRVIAPILSARAAAVTGVTALLDPFESACRLGQGVLLGAARPSRLWAHDQSASARDCAYCLPDRREARVLLGELDKDGS